MDLLLERCAGIDIGKDEVVACVRTPGPGGRGRRKDTRSFRSFVGDLEAMADWFAAEGVTEVAMEATASYWKPVWYVLEDRGVDLKLVNAHHLKILPGRKSDILDAEWIAELLEHGLLRGSFVPPRVIRELRGGDLRRGDERPPQQAALEQLGQPFGILDVGLATGQVPEVGRVDQQQLEPGSFEDVPYRAPIDAGGLHRHLGDALANQPVAQLD